MLRIAVVAALACALIGAFPLAAQAEGDGGSASCDDVTCGGSGFGNDNPKNSSPHPPAAPLPSAPPAPPGLPEESTKPELCPGHQIVNGKHKCDLVVTHPADDTPSDTQLREVIAKLRLPDPTPRLGPDPSVNEWNMLAVGYPIWLWTDHPTQLTTTAHHDGLTFTLEATRTNTSFTMGDGNTKQCATTTPYPGYTGNTSPTCSYTYDTASPVGHPYTLTATTTWNITWATGTHHGTLTHTTTGTRTLDVGELHSLIIG